MMNLLTLEYAHVKKSMLEEVVCDCKACFDWIEKSQSNIYTQKQNFDMSLIKVRAICMKRMQHHFKTGLGISIYSYQEEQG